MSDIIARALASKNASQLADIAINPKSFGCKGDGVTDDTANFTTAISNTPVDGTIIIPKGATFLISSVINITKRINIVGQGGTFQLGANSFYIFSIQADDCRITGVNAINPNGYKTITGNNNRSGFIQIKANRVRVTNCKIDGMTQGILQEPGYSNAQIISNTVTNVLGIASEGDGDGIALYSPYGIVIGNIVSCKPGTDARIGIVLDLSGDHGIIQGNQISGAFRRSIHLETSNYSNVIGNVCMGATQWTIYLNASYCSVSNNTVQTPAVSPGPLGTPIDGIYVYGNNNVTISGNNIISGGAGEGIRVTGSHHSITDNQFSGAANSLTNAIVSGATFTAIKGNHIVAKLCSAEGIYVYGANHNEVIGNNVEQCNSHGIHVFGGSLNCIIKDNISANNNGAGIQIEGASHEAIISGNRCFDNQATKTQTYGIYNYSCNNVRIYGNNVDGNQTSLLPNNGGATGVTTENNQGYNPVGLITAPTLPASGTPYTNNNPYVVRVLVSGGTVTNIGINGTNTGLTNGMVILYPGDTITLTYSVAPTWTWFGM